MTDISRTDRRRMLDVWRGMVARCHDSRSVSFPYYGAKGILVCDRWRSSFDAFLEDIQNMSAWAAEIGISPQCLHYRLVNGWPVAAALTLPKGSAYRPNPRKTGYTYRGVKK